MSMHNSGKLCWHDLLLACLQSPPESTSHAPLPQLGSSMYSVVLHYGIAVCCENYSWINLIGSRSMVRPAYTIFFHGDYPKAKLLLPRWSAPLLHKPSRKRSWGLTGNVDEDNGYAGPFFPHSP